MEPATCAHLGHLHTVPARSGARTGCCRTSGKAAGTTVSTRDLQEHRPAPTGNDAEQHAASPRPRWLVGPHGEVVGGGRASAASYSRLAVDHHRRSMAVALPLQ